MRKFRRRKKRGPVVSKKVTVDGIKFASGFSFNIFKSLFKNIFYDIYIIFEENAKGISPYYV